MEVPASVQRAAEAAGCEPAKLAAASVRWPRPEAPATHSHTDSDWTAQMARWDRSRARPHGRACAAPSAVTGARQDRTRDTAGIGAVPRGRPGRNRSLRTVRIGGLVGAAAIRGLDLLARALHVLARAFHGVAAYQQGSAQQRHRGDRSRQPDRQCLHSKSISGTSYSQAACLRLLRAARTYSSIPHACASVRMHSASGGIARTQGGDVPSVSGAVGS